jgi:hypothetical protein
MAKFLIDKKENKIYKLEVFSFNLSNWQEIIEIPDVEDVSELVYENGTIRLKTNEEKIQEKKNELQNQRKQKVASLLAQTDYVITKISDLKTQLELGIITSDTYNAELQKYLLILQKRHNIRDWNTSIEERIKQATTLEELKQIEQEINEYQG